MQTPKNVAHSKQIPYDIRQEQRECKARENGGTTQTLHVFGQSCE